MGEIREELILSDQFSASFSRFLTLGNSMISQMADINTSIHEIGDASEFLADSQRFFLFSRSAKIVSIMLSSYQ